MHCNELFDFKPLTVRVGILATNHQEYKLIITVVVASAGVAKPPPPQFRKGYLVRISLHSCVVRVRGPTATYKIEVLVLSVLHSTGVTVKIRSLHGVSMEIFAY